MVPFGSELEPLERRIGYRFKRSRPAGARADPPIARARGRQRRRGRQRVAGVPRRFGARLRHRRRCCSASFPQHNEGQKSKIKASLVSAASLARLGERLGLGDFLILGRGEEKTGGRRKHALIADCYEALIAAIYLDGGIEPARTFIARSSRSCIEEAAGPALRRLHRRLQVGAAGIAAVARPRRCRSTASSARGRPDHRKVRGGSEVGGEAWRAPRAGARRKRHRRPRSWRSRV